MTRMDGWIPPRWNALLGRLGCRLDALELLAELDARYSSPSRFYHGWSHVLMCLRELDGVAQVLDEPVLVEAALWFHDAIYDTHGGANESLSAAWASCALGDLGVDAGRVARVGELVRATDHTGPAPPGDVDAAFIRDIDLAILGAREADFAAYDRAIRTEYAHIEEGRYRRGRLAVLKALAERDFIYLSERYREALETRARANLTAAIRLLELAD